MRRVVVTGLGVVAPNGVGKEAFWKACVEGHSGVGPIRSFDASAHPVKIAAEVPDFDVQPVRARTSTARASRSWAGPCASAWRAAALAVQRQRPGPGRREDPERVGVVMGTGLVPIDLPEVAPLLAESCDATAGWSVDRLGQRGGEAPVPAVDPQVPAEHGRRPHLDGPSTPRGPTAPSPRPAPPARRRSARRSA